MKDRSLEFKLMLTRISKVDMDDLVLESCGWCRLLLDSDCVTVADVKDNFVHGTKLGRYCELL